MDKVLIVKGVPKKVTVEGNIIKIEDSIVDIPLNEVGLLGTTVYGVIYQESEDSDEIIIKDNIDVILDIFKDKGFEVSDREIQD